MCLIVSFVACDLFDVICLFCFAFCLVCYVLRCVGLWCVRCFAFCVGVLGLFVLCLFVCFVCVCLCLGGVAFVCDLCVCLMCSLCMCVIVVVCLWLRVSFRCAASRRVSLFVFRLFSF